MTQQDIQDVILVACEVFGITSEHLHSSSRLHRVTVPRKFIWKFLREEKGVTWKSIADSFHKDHSTIMKGVESINDNLEFSKHLVYDYAEFKDLALDKVPNHDSLDPNETTCPSEFYGGRKY